MFRSSPWESVDDSSRSIAGLAIAGAVICPPSSLSSNGFNALKGEHHGELAGVVDIVREDSPEGPMA